MRDGEPEELYREALRKIQRFIEHKPRTVFEIRKKLKGLGYEDCTIDEAVGRLLKNRVLDDERFMNIYGGELLRKRYGYKRILIELSKKGIDKDIIERFKEQYPHETEIERAQEACLSKFQKSGGCEKSGDEAKIIEFLLRRGFLKDVAEKAVRSLIEEV